MASINALGGFNHVMSTNSATNLNSEIIEIEQHLDNINLNSLHSTDSLIQIANKNEQHLKKMSNDLFRLNEKLNSGNILLNSYFSGLFMINQYIYSPISVSTFICIIIIQKNF